MLRWKWLFIVGITVLSVIVALPLDKKIHLGLDLKGGVHLMLRVMTDDAVRAELDEGINRVRMRLDDKQVKYGSVERLMDPDGGLYKVVVRGVEGENLDKARKIVESQLQGFKFDIGSNEVGASLPTQRLADIRDSAVEQARNTIDERINASGIAEPLIQRQGLSSDRILVQLPGASDPEYVKRLIGRVAFLEFRMVNDRPMGSREALLERHQGSLPGNLEIVEGVDEDANTLFYAVDRVPVVTGRDLATATLQRDQFGQPAIGFSFNAEGAKKFGDATGRNIGKQLAILLDGRVKSAPVVQSKISDRGEITGAFTVEEARELVLTLRAGALPASIQYLEERTVGPTLGKDSIDKGIVSSLIGLVAIVIGMVGYYRLSGLNAVVAVILNGVLLLGAMAAFKATLTLPGIAGFILTLGMAVDANVLIFEAIRESIRNGIPPRRAIEEGFDRAFTTIVDANLTTILAAGALWMLGAGPVRGFGVTLFIGLVISMFTSYYVSKVIFETFVLNRDWKPGDTLSI